MVIIHSYVSLPEGRTILGSIWGQESNEPNESNHVTQRFLATLHRGSRDGRVVRVEPEKSQPCGWGPGDGLLKNPILVGKKPMGFCYPNLPNMWGVIMAHHG